MEGGIRHKFQPRFDGPGEFFRGPPGGPPGGVYDDVPHQRHRRYEDRRRHRQDFEGENERELRERNSRWSNGSPHQEDGMNVTSEGVESEAPESAAENDGAKVERGNTTPLHDEPQEPHQQEVQPEEAAPAEMNPEPEAKTEQE